jgi:hypothetical protein
MRVRLLMIVVLGLVAGCGNKDKTTPPKTGSGSGSDLPEIVAETTLGWGRQPATGGKLNLFLEVTDHTGQTKSYPLGESLVPCQVAKGSGTDVVTSLMCLTDGMGAEFRAVYRANQIIVLRRPVDPSDDPAEIELSFREVQRVDVPVGSKVTAAE